MTKNNHEDNTMAFVATNLGGEQVAVLVPRETTAITANEAMVRLYAWKQVRRRGSDDPGYSEPVRLGNVWHSAEWETSGLCGACGDQISLLTEGTGWMIPCCRSEGLHNSLTLKDHLALVRHRTEARSADDDDVEDDGSGPEDGDEGDCYPIDIRNPYHHDV